MQWMVKETNQANIIEQIKKNRNYPDSFYQAGWNDLPNLSLMKDLDKASERIIEALQNKETLIIYGHDDLDGITSTYLLYDFLETIGFQNHYYYIPNRYLENHGIQNGLIKKAKEIACSLLITVDNGISSYEAVAELNKIGCDVVITDHHLVPSNLPPACAIVNPKQKDCQYPYKMLAGVGVAYCLVNKIAEKLEVPCPDNYLLWTCVGSIADRVPLQGVNRIFIKKCLEIWDTFSDTTFLTFRKMFWKADGVQSKLALMRQIIKAFNGGRLANGEHKALHALVALSQEKEALIKELMEIHAVHEEKLNFAITKLSSIIPSHVQTHWIFYDEKDVLPYNTLGYCASVLAQEKMIPVVLLKKRNGNIVCEARCTDGFDLVDSFRYCKHHLLQFGGHKRAAGFTTTPEMIESFTKAFNKYVGFHKDEILNQRTIEVDAVLDFDTEQEQLSILHYGLSIFQPFGEGNPEPVILIKNFLWERDHLLLPIRNEHSDLRAEHKFDIVITCSGSNANLIDYKRSGEKDEAEQRKM